MSSNAPITAEKRFASDQLMVELGHALVEKGIVTRQALDDLNARRAFSSDPLDRMLISESLASEQDVLSTLSELTNIPFHHIAELSIEPEAVARVQARAALRYGIVPIRLAGGVITLATSRVPALSTVDSLRMLLNLGLDWILCTETDVSKTVKHFYGLGADTIDNLVDESRGDEVEVTGQDVSTDTADAGVIRFVNQIISEAIRMNATDIHIEPYETALRLRYRVDGILQEIPMPKGVAHLKRAIASCVKIMADCNIAERRKPHDGRIKVRFDNDEFDLRVSILPTAYGETVNMRILNRKAMFIDLEHLGLTGAQAPAIKYLSSLPHGVILLTGPTGSGKTTTLYALLSRVNTSEVKIITVEDPIEYQISGINQVQVHAQIGVTFASVLRSILRHDPDIVLIGEIRDTETADIAVRASLTGHLVFSTLHTNDAPSAIARLVDMGVESYLISSCLEGVIAQRLVRRVCPACREPYQPEDVILAEIAELFPERSKTAEYVKGRGCPDCNFTGYRSRIALFEIMVMDDAIRSMVVHQRPSNEIRNYAVEHGLVTLRQDGWLRVMSGMTTVDEVIRVARKLETTRGITA